MNSDNLVLKCLGWGGLVYLFLCHMVLLCIPRNRLELQRSYLPVFFLKRRKAQTATEAVEQDSNDEDMSFCSRKCVEMQIEVRNLRRKVLVEAYKMTAPARQWAMIVEDAPQGFLAAVVSLTNGFRLFTVAVSIFVPSLRIAFSRLLHDRIAWAVQGWMLQEALAALDHDRFEVCDEFLASIFRLRWVFPERDLGVSLCESSRSTIEEVVRKFLEVRPFRRRHEELDGPEAFVRLMCLELLGREEPGPSSWGEEFIEILKQMRSHELTNVAETIAMASRRIRFRDWREETLALLRPSPRLISKLTQITSLSLNDSRSLEGLDQLKNLTSLQLELQRKAIGSEGCGPLGEGLAQLKNLTSVQLQLQGSGIRSEDCRPLGEGLAQLKNLTSVQLQLQENKIGQEGCKLLGEGLAQLLNLGEPNWFRRLPPPWRRIGSAEEAHVCPAPVAGEQNWSRRLQAARRRIGSAAEPYVCPAPVAGEPNWFRRLPPPWRRIGSAEEPHVSPAPVAEERNWFRRLQVPWRRIGSAEEPHNFPAPVAGERNWLRRLQAPWRRIGSAEEPHVCPAPVAGEPNRLRRLQGAWARHGSIDKSHVCPARVAEEPNFFRRLQSAWPKLDPVDKPHFCQDRFAG